MRNSFVLYTEYKKHFPLLTMEQRGLLFTAIMEYQSGEALPEMDSGVAMAFSFIREQLDRDEAKYAETARKRSEAGAQGGRPRKQTEADDSLCDDEKTKKANAFCENQTEATGSKRKQNNPDNEYVDEYVDVDSISNRKKERNIKKTSTGAPAREGGGEEYLSHADIMNQFGIKGRYREILENYLRACYLNGHIVPNDVLRDLLSRLDKYYQDDEDAKILAIRKALNGGYYDIVELRDAPELWR